MNFLAGCLDVLTLCYLVIFDKRISLLRYPGYAIYIVLGRMELFFHSLETSVVAKVSSLIVD